MGGHVFCVHRDAHSLLWKRRRGRTRTRRRKKRRRRGREGLQGRSGTKTTMPLWCEQAQGQKGQRGRRRRRVVFKERSRSEVRRPAHHERGPLPQREGRSRGSAGAAGTPAAPAPWASGWAACPCRASPLPRPQPQRLASAFPPLRGGPQAQYPLPTPRGPGPSWHHPLCSATPRGASRAPLSSARRAVPRPRGPAAALCGGRGALGAPGGEGAPGGGAGGGARGVALLLGAVGGPRPALARPRRPPAPLRSPRTTRLPRTTRSPHTTRSLCTQKAAPARHQGAGGCGKGRGEEGRAVPESLFLPYQAEEASGASIRSSFGHMGSSTAGESASGGASHSRLPQPGKTLSSERDEGEWQQHKGDGH